MQFFAIKSLFNSLSGKGWHEGFMKAKHIYSRLKHGSPWDSYSLKEINTNSEMLSVKKSPFNSSIGSRVSSLNNSHRYPRQKYFSFLVQSNYVCRLQIFNQMPFKYFQWFCWSKWSKEHLCGLWEGQFAIQWWGYDHGDRQYLFVTVEGTTLQSYESKGHNI